MKVHVNTIWGGKAYPPKNKIQNPVQLKLAVDSYMLHESQIGPETSLNEEIGDELLFYGLGIVQYKDSE